MWGLFFATVIAALLLLVVPGFFAFRALGFDRLESLICSPLASMLLCSIVTAALWKLGVFCTWWMLLLVCVILAFVFFFVSAVVRRNALSHEAEPAFSSSEGEGRFSHFACGAPTLLLYLVVAAIVYVYMFVLNADGPSSFVQYYDNLHHMGSIQTFLLSGNWSSFGVTCYPEEIAGGISPTGSHSSFYPSAWHCIAAFASSLTGAEVAIAENASLAAFVVFVFPAGMFLLLRELFPDKPMVVLCGAVCASAFAFYPWRLMTFGPLFPNLAAMSQIPAAAFLFLRITEKGLSRSRRVVLGATFVAALGSLAFSQPNAVFTLGVFLAPYLVVLASKIPSFKKEKEAAASARTLCGIAAVAVIAGIWFACYKLPFLQSVVSYSWDSYASVFQAVRDVLLMRFLYHPPQVVLSLAVFFGVLAAWRDRKRLWLVASFAIAACMCVAAASCDGAIRHVLTGFWYTDPNRIIAILVVFAIPLASWGVAAVCKVVIDAVRKVGRLGGGASRCSVCAAGAVLFVFSACTFWPNYLLTGSVDEINAFDIAGFYMRDAFQDAHNGFYDQLERDFVQECLSLVEDDEVIANVPCDGSACAFGADAASVLYRFYDDAGSGSELVSSETLRMGLCDIAESQVVRDAAVELNVEYVLKLDRGAHGGAGMYDFCYNAEQWRGIEAVDDDTPGFEVVLAEGDMRLYRIVAA